MVFVTDMSNSKKAYPDQRLPYHKKTSVRGKARVVRLSLTLISLFTEEKP